MMIPQQLQQQEINFVLLERSGKKPFQQGWQNKEIKYNDQEIIEHLKNKGNYGVMGGGKKNLVIIDFDNKELQDKLLNKLPPTFTVKTGSGLYHLYYFSDKADSFKIFDEEMNTLADVQGQGKQVVGPSSIHPNGNVYEIIKDIPLAFLNYSEIKAHILPYDRKPKKKVEEKKEVIKLSGLSDNFIDVCKSNIKMPDLLQHFGIDTSLNPTQCLFHSSKGGKCLGFTDEIAHCFHCDNSWNIFSLVKQEKNCDFKGALEYLADNFGLTNELEDSRKQYRQQQIEKSNSNDMLIKLEFLEMISGKNKNWGKATELLRDYVMDKLNIYTIKDDLKTEMWCYSDGVYLPQGKSEIKVLLRNLLGDSYSQFVLNKVIEKIEPDTFIDINDFFRTRYVEEIPLENGILNVRTLELSPFTPDKIFFNKFPVKFDLSAQCPKIDSFLRDVLMNEEDVKVFYELAGFGLTKEYFIEKACMMVGDGRNGKSKSIELLKRLVGADNCCSIPLTSLVSDSFSVSELFGKMFNLAGDIGNNDLKDTSMFKALTGRDLVSGKRKFQRDIHFENYSKFIFACNELPMVYDSSKGFWSRWILLEFPYTFIPKEEYDLTEEKKFLKIRNINIIKEITSEEEMSGFLNQALIGLQRLRDKKDFSSTKGSEEIKNKWIRKSNSFMAFCYEYLEESYDSTISKKDLRRKYAEYCNKNKVSSKSDYVIKRVLQDLFGASDDKKQVIDGYFDHIWVGVRFK